MYFDLLVSFAGGACLLLWDYLRLLERLDLLGLSILFFLLASNYFFYFFKLIASKWISNLLNSMNLTEILLNPRESQNIIKVYF